MPAGYYNKTGLPIVPPSRKGTKLTKHQKFIAGKANRGKKRTFTEEWKNKISQTLKRKYKEGKLVFKITREERLRRGLKRRTNGIPRKSLEKQLWKGRTEWKNWRKKVFERDNYTCQDCGQRGGCLEPHHVKSWSEYPALRFLVSNGLTLCKDCHRKTDNYGYKAIIKK